MHVCVRMLYILHITVTLFCVKITLTTDLLMSKFTDYQMASHFGILNMRGNVILSGRMEVNGMFFTNGNRRTTQNQMVHNFLKGW